MLTLPHSTINPPRRTTDRRGAVTCASASTSPGKAPCNCRARGLPRRADAPRLAGIHRTNERNDKNGKNRSILSHAANDDAPTTASTSHTSSIAVFVSGGGSNFKAIHADIEQGVINGTVSVVVTNAPSCAAAGYARDHGIPVVVYPPGKHASDDEKTVCGSPRELVDALNARDVDLIVLAGYMKLIPIEVVRAFERRMLNIHPGLLPGPFGGPGMYGMHVHAAVVASGTRVSGCTVHFVNEVFDDGPILGQAVVPVYVTDTPERVAARVLKQEHELFPRCVRAFCDGRVGWREDGVPYIVEML